MDIALRVPELVDSHELRFHINKVSGDNKLTRTIHYVYGAMVQCWSSVCPDAAAEQPVSAETPWVTTGPPGPQHDNHGLCLAGGRKQHSWGVFVSFSLNFCHIDFFLSSLPDCKQLLYSLQFILMTFHFNNLPLRYCHITWPSHSGRCHSAWDFPPFSPMQMQYWLTGGRRIQRGKASYVLDVVWLPPEQVSGIKLFSFFYMFICMSPGPGLLTWSE